MPDVGHKWSGWPGAYCLKCGSEHALENAVALGWVSIAGPPDEDGVTWPDVWITEDHRRLVELCDNNCYADMSGELVQMHKKWASDLEAKIKAWEQSEAGQRHLQAMSQHKPQTQVGEPTGKGT